MLAILCRSVLAMIIGLAMALHYAPTCTEPLTVGCLAWTKITELSYRRILRRMKATIIACEGFREGTSMVHSQPNTFLNQIGLVGIGNTFLKPNHFPLPNCCVSKVI